MSSINNSQDGNDDSSFGKSTTFVFKRSSSPYQSPYNVSATTTTNKTTIRTADGASNNLIPQQSSYIGAAICIGFALFIFILLCCPAKMTTAHAEERPRHASRSMEGSSSTSKPKRTRRRIGCVLQRIKESGNQVIVAEENLKAASPQVEVVQADKPDTSAKKSFDQEIDQGIPLEDAIESIPKEEVVDIEAPASSSFSTMSLSSRDEESNQLEDTEELVGQLVLPTNPRSLKKDDQAEDSKHQHCCETTTEQGDFWTPDLCAICLNGYRVKDKVVWSQDMNCPHVFHRDCFVDCLMAHVGDSSPCPMCRRDFFDPSIYLLSAEEE